MFQYCACKFSGQVRFQVRDLETLVRKSSIHILSSPSEVEESDGNFEPPSSPKTKQWAKLNCFPSCLYFLLDSRRRKSLKRFCFQKGLKAAGMSTEGVMNLLIANTLVLWSHEKLQSPRSWAGDSDGEQIKTQPAPSTAARQRVVVAFRPLTSRWDRTVLSSRPDWATRFYGEREAAQLQEGGGGEETVSVDFTSKETKNI